MSIESLPDDRPSVALIAGPTASGKSALALSFAERTGGVIVNADASQVYRDLSILSARPSPDEETRADHRLFGYIDGAMACSAARWAADAKEEIESAHAAGRLPILAGGTGLYIRTLLDGIAPIPQINSAVRQHVREMPIEDAYAALTLEDPAAATVLNPADKTRVARALEVIRSTGKSALDWRRQRHGGIGERISLHPVILIPDRALLYQCCDARFDAMLSAGAIDEIRALLARDLDPELPVMRAIGVRELAAVIEGRLSMDDAARIAKQATRNYAKRQLTWFRRQPPAGWPRCADSDSAMKIFTELTSNYP